MMPRYLWAVAVGAVFSRLLALAPSGSLMAVGEEPGSPDFSFWLIGDPHIQTDLDMQPQYRSLEAAIKDARFGGDEGGERFDWDIALVTGDYTGRLQCPDDSFGRDLVEQFQRSGADPNCFYGVIGNHDADPENLWFQKWIDPLGTHTAFSGVDNNKRPYPTQGEWDHYSFTVGNTLFLMLGDRNEGPPPFGRVCRYGYPAGRLSEATFRWWVQQVESHPNSIIVTVAHHALWNTTVYTDFWEGYQQGIHGGHSWADRVGSSMVYAIGDWTIDGFDSDRSYKGERPYGFVLYLQEHPGAIDLWIHGHTHTNVYPGIVFNGRSDIEIRYGVIFLNSGALTKAHSLMSAPFSRLVDLFQDSTRLRIRTYMHSGDWEKADEGFYDPATFEGDLAKPFRLSEP